MKVAALAIVASLGILAPLTSVAADAPLGVILPVQTLCAGTPTNGACVTIDRRTGRTTMRRRHAPHIILWAIKATPAAAVPSPDGRFLVEEHRPGGLVEEGDGPTTTMLTLYDGGRIVRRVTLGDLTTGADEPPATASHRVWSSARYFIDPTHYVVVLANGRKVHLDLVEQSRTRLAR